MLWKHFVFCNLHFAFCILHFEFCIVRWKSGKLERDQLVGAHFCRTLTCVSNRCQVWRFKKKKTELRITLSKKLSIMCCTFISSSSIKFIPKSLLKFQLCDWLSLSCKPNFLIGLSKKETLGGKMSFPLLQSAPELKIFWHEYSPLQNCPCTYMHFDNA